MVHAQITQLKGHCHSDFSAIFNKAEVKPWVSAISRTRNAPRTSRERYQIKY